MENTLVLPLILPQFSLYLEKSSPVWAASPGYGRASYLIAFFSPPSSWKQKELQEQGEIRVIQLGFDLDAHGIVLTEDYRTRVRVLGVRGRRLSHSTPPHLPGHGALVGSNRRHRKEREERSERWDELGRRGSASHVPRNVPQPLIPASRSSRPAMAGPTPGPCRSFWLWCCQPVGTLASSRTK